MPLAKITDIEGLTWNVAPLAQCARLVPADALVDDVGRGWILADDNHPTLFGRKVESVEVIAFRAVAKLERHGSITGSRPLRWLVPVSDGGFSTGLPAPDVDDLGSSDGYDEESGEDRLDRRWRVDVNPNTESDHWTGVASFNTHSDAVDSAQTRAQGFADRHRPNAQVRIVENADATGAVAIEPSLVVCRCGATATQQRVEREGVESMPHQADCPYAPTPKDLRWFVIEVWHDDGVVAMAGPYDSEDAATAAIPEIARENIDGPTGPDGEPVDGERHPESDKLVELAQRGLHPDFALHVVACDLNRSAS